MPANSDHPCTVCGELQRTLGVDHAGGKNAPITVPVSTGQLMFAANPRGDRIFPGTDCIFVSRAGTDL